MFSICRSGKKLKLAQPQQFMAQDREIVEEAYAGDIIGVFDPGIFTIGDTLCSPKRNLNLKEFSLCSRTLCKSKASRYNEENNL